jgi:uncharacterized protein YbjT (DUF2867 family)
MKFLVTGATGTVGGEVLKQLVSEGADIRAVTREASKADLPDGVELVEADLTVAEDVARALSGIRATSLQAPLQLCSRRSRVPGITRSRGLRRSAPVKRWRSSVSCSERRSASRS